MCGIAGFYGPEDKRKLKEMVRALVHRGPDEEGFYSDKKLSMGMRRLSIVDLKSGHQPVYNEDKEIVAVFNGEIYNFAILKKDLQKKGHVFYTKTDSEVIVHLYEEYQENFVKFLDGMFAIAVWDKRQDCLVLARDRFGKKPLYYSQFGDELYFASEIKSILVHPKVKKDLNFEALYHYFSFKYVPGPLSIYEGIFSLPPASVMVFKDGKKNIRTYWELKYDWNSEDNETKIIDNLDKQLRDAVEKRMMGDVPVGAYLSGGVDSSLVVALYSMLAPGKVKTFSLIYGSELSNKNTDEQFARLVSLKYKTEHFVYKMEDQEIFDDLENILSSFDEPFAGVVSTYFISKLIKRQVKVAISGDGADELFGSYLAPRLAYPISNYLAARRDADSLAPFEKKMEFLKSMAEHDEWRWRAKLMVFSDEEKRSIFSPNASALFDTFDTASLYRKYFNDSKAKDPLNRVLDVDCRSLLADGVLPFIDRLSMAHSIEVRCPYLDYKMAEYVAGLGGGWKIRRGETKYILKRLAERYLPKDLIYRPKEGFISPINQWLPKHKDYINSILSKQNLKQHGLFKFESVQKLIKNLKLDDTASVNKVWVLINFQVWYDSMFK